MYDLIQTLKENKTVSKELSLHLVSKKIVVADFLLKFQQIWQLGYFLEFLHNRYKCTIFVNGNVYVVFVKVGETERLVVDERVEITNVIDTYMEAICAAIKYLEKPF